MLVVDLLHLVLVVGVELIHEGRVGNSVVPVLPL
jgi:hypothetical protein